MRFSAQSCLNKYCEKDEEPAPGVSEQEFLQNYYSLVNTAGGITENYYKEIGKWERGEYDDLQIVSITNAYLTEYDGLIDSASSKSSVLHYATIY